MIPPSPIVRFPDVVITKEMEDKAKKLAERGFSGRDISVLMRINIRQVFLIVRGKEYFDRFELEGMENNTIPSLNVVGGKK